MPITSNLLFREAGAGYFPPGGDASPAPVTTSRALEHMWPDAKQNYTLIIGKEIDTFFVKATKTIGYILLSFISIPAPAGAFPARFGGMCSPPAQNPTVRIVGRAMRHPSLLIAANKCKCTCGTVMG